MNMKKRILAASIVVVALAAFLGGSIFAARSNTAEQIVTNDTLVAQMTQVSQLEAHAASIQAVNEAMANTSLQDVICTVSFSRYLSFDEFSALMDEYDFEVVQIQLRGIDNENGDRITIAANLDYGLERVMGSVQSTSERQNYDFKGITGMNALMDSDTVVAMSQDEDVYLVDTSADLYSVAKTNGNLLNQTFSTMASGNVRNAYLGHVSDSNFPKSVTWEMENFGLMKDN